MKRFESANIVIVAKNMNPSRFSQIWLIDEGIIEKGEFGDNCIFSPMLTHIFASSFQLLVMQDRLQVVFTPESLDEPVSLLGKTKLIIQKLLHIQYIAIGANFLWLIAPDRPTDVVKFMNALFFRDSMPLYKSFTSPDARFGAYLSKDFLGARMKLDIKPASMNESGDMQEHLRFNFNYHLGLGQGEQANQMLEFIGNWEKMKQEADEITSDALSIKI